MNAKKETEGRRTILHQSSWQSFFQPSWTPSLEEKSGARISGLWHKTRERKSCPESHWVEETCLTTLLRDKRASGWRGPSKKILVSTSLKLVPVKEISPAAAAVDALKDKLDKKLKLEWINGSTLEIWSWTYPSKWQLLESTFTHSSKTIPRIHCSNKTLPNIEYSFERYYKASFCSNNLQGSQKCFNE